MNIDCLNGLIIETDCLDTMNLEMNARLVAGADFDRGANTNPYPKQSAACLFYEAEYLALTDNQPVVTDDHQN